MLSLLLDDPLIPRWQSRYAPMAECLQWMVEGAHRILTLAQTRRLHRIPHCEGLQAPHSRSVSPIPIVRRASIAKSVVVLSRRLLEREIPRQTTRKTPQPYRL